MPKFMWALWVSWCNLVPQLPRVITFSYDLYFRRVKARWKGVLERYTFCLLEYRRWCARFTIDDTLITQPQAEASLRAP